MAAVPHKRRLHVMVHVRRDTIARRGRHQQNKMRVRRIRPVRRGLMHVQTVHVMRDMAVMQQRVRVQSVRRDTINPVQAIHHVQTVVRGITVPVVRHVRRVRRVHTVQRPT